MGIILIGQSEPLMTTLLSHRLVSVGYSVLTAVDGETVLNSASWSRPSLIVLDEYLPDTGGVTLLQTLKGQAATASIPVMMLMAGLREDQIVAAIAAGAADCVSKPVRPHEFAARVGRLVGMKKRAA